MTASPASVTDDDRMVVGGLTIAFFAWLGSVTALALAPGAQGLFGAAAVVGAAVYRLARGQRGLFNSSTLAAASAFLLSGSAEAHRFARLAAVATGQQQLLIEITSAFIPVEAEAAWMTDQVAPRRIHFEAMAHPVRGEPFALALTAPVELQPVPGQHYLVSGELVPWPRANWEFGFDARATFWRRGLVGSMAVPSVELFERHAQNESSASWASRLSNSIARYQRRLALDMGAGQSRGGALAAAIIVGDRLGVTRADNQTLAAAGINHVLSVSGLHLSAAAMVFYWLWRMVLGLAVRWWAFSAKRWAAVLCLPAIFYYAWLTGAELPAMRSALMTALAMLAVASGTGSDIRRTLAATLLIQVFTSPLGTLEPSFMFSFGSVFVLAQFARQWQPPQAEHWRERALGWFKGMAICSLIASAFSWPLSAYFFQSVSCAGLWANFFAIPLTSGIMVPLGLLWFAAHSVGFGASTLAHVLAWSGELLRFLAARSSLAWPLFLSPREVVLYLLVLLLVLTPQRRQLYRITVVVAFLFVLSFAWPWLERHASHHLEADFLPVGQGDGLVLFSPGGGVTVVDAGGDYAGAVDPGEHVVTPFLLSRRVFSIDRIILSHPHPDHYGGLTSLFRHFHVDDFVWNGQPQSAAGFGHVLAGIRQPRILASSDELRIPGISVEILHPRTGDEETYFPELGYNDNSIVLRLGFGGRHLLLMGDVEKLGEDWLMEHSAEALSADVVKLGHHGSKTSSSQAFLSAIHPHQAIISVGAHNRFGHPSPSVIKRLSEDGIAAWRTDEHGLISVSFARDGSPPRVDVYTDRSLLE